MHAAVFGEWQFARVGANARSGAIQGVCATVLQIAEQLAVIQVGVVVGVAVGPVGPQEGVSDRAFVVRLSVRRFEGSGMSRRRGGRGGRGRCRRSSRWVSVRGERWHGCFLIPRETG